MPVGPYWELGTPRLEQFQMRTLSKFPPRHTTVARLRITLELPREAGPIPTMSRTMEEEVRGIPFWQDLMAVTDAVPPWGVFKELAEHPETIIRVPVPLTFLLAPGDKIEARLCTGLDNKILARRSSVRDPITIDMMARNLKSVFDERGSDGQPCVCTAYGEDWRPYFVLSEVFNLFILYLCHQCGVAATSYGPEEQREANALFPRKIACVQAYIPLESQTRYLGITLQTPVNKMTEVYRAQHLGRGCFSNRNDTLDSIITVHSRGENDFYQPISSKDTIARAASKISASVVCQLRKQCGLKAPGLVLEFVRDVQGDVYLVGVVRCSKPQAPRLRTTIQPWRPSDSHLVHILGQGPLRPAQKHRQSANPSSVADPSSAPGTQPSSPSIKQAPVASSSAVPPIANWKKAAPPGLSIVSEVSEGPETALQTAGPQKERKKISLAVNPETPLDDSPSKEGVSFLKSSPGRRHDPVCASTSSSGSDLLLLGDDPNDGEALSKLHQRLILRAQQLHDDGLFQESVDVLKEAEKEGLDAMAKTRPEYAAKLKAQPPNAECFRCGDKVHANFEKAGFAHFEWRMKSSTAAARETSRKLREKAMQNRLVNSRRSRRVDQLHHALGKLEATLDTTPREDYDIGQVKMLPTTICQQCLHEAKSDIRNSQYISSILRFRNELKIPINAGAHGK